MSNITLSPRDIVVAARPKFEAVKSNLDFGKEAGFALQILQKNTFLAKTNPESIKNAIVNCALTGLTLNPVLKLAYLVPRKGECVLDPSYMGLIKVLTDAGSVKNIYAEVVYESDHFFIEQGTNPKIDHKPEVLGNRGKKIGVYAVAFLLNGGYQFEFMRADQVNAIKQRSEMGKKNDGSWKTDEDEMWKKTVVKRLYKYLPKSEISEAVVKALQLENQNNGIDFDEERAAKAKASASMLFDEAEDVTDQKAIATGTEQAQDAEVEVTETNA
ncbi:recombinase RecT [Pontibacter burrus]|uniref:Recombinase RecT n=1 Tax=Pontibacter burrus TaxID=2704466 RepID=A0A6B3LRS2_9BACT|nr:recombinase RecT [Pontibacter burrus]NEM96194.1 recombinase RecT [Pontibacter burrus]